jgi:hypothetical protein
MVGLLAVGDESMARSDTEATATTTEKKHNGRPTTHDAYSAANMLRYTRGLERLTTRTHYVLLTGCCWLLGKHYVFLLVLHVGYYGRVCL